MNKKAVLEGLLFVVGDEGLTLTQIRDILEIELDEAKALILDLKSSYEAEDRGIKLQILGDSFKLTTKKEHKEYYKRLVENPESNTLSDAALETLAIVAYNQPITRLKVDEIRGIASQQMIRKLVAKGLIKESGRCQDIPGRPILYATTHEFLDFFGLSTIDDLPSIDMTISVEEKDDLDLYESKYKENE